MKLAIMLTMAKENGHDEYDEAEKKDEAEHDDDRGRGKDGRRMKLIMKMAVAKGRMVMTKMQWWFT